MFSILESSTSPPLMARILVIEYPWLSVPQINNLFHWSNAYMSSLYPQNSTPQIKFIILMIGIDCNSTLVVVIIERDENSIFCSKYGMIILQVQMHIIRRNFTLNMEILNMKIDCVINQFPKSMLRQLMSFNTFDLHKIKLFTI